jgi:two-component system phosphate regulon sensor histidine kinase PhoR
MCYNILMPKKKKKTDGSRDLEFLRRMFVRIVSHQLRTPLSAVRWNLEMLLEERLGPLNDAQREFIRISDESTVEVLRRISNLLTAIEIEEGHITLEKEKVDLARVCKAALQPCRARAHSKEQNFKLSTPKSLPGVSVDPAKIRFVFQELVDDAIDYTPAKGTITAKLTKKGKKIRFEVTDSGIGVPEEDEKHIFERFYRGSNAYTMKQDASGISLSIAKFYIEQHGGSMGFESEEGKGSTFWVEVTR